jgi:murein L,D-transpeptidase YcbB/YkuD
MFKPLLLAILLTAASFVHAQDISENIKKLVTSNNSIQKLGKYLIQVDSLKKIYEANGYQPVWVQGQKLSGAAVEFVEVLKNPNEFGFAKNDFIDPQLEQLLTKEKSESNLFWLEVLLTDKWIQMSKYLYQGRLADYYILDDDTKLPKKNFNRWEELKVILSAVKEKEDVRDGLSDMEPNNRIYKS